LVLAHDGALFLADDVESDAGLLLRLNADSDQEAMRRAAEAYAGQLLDGFPPVSKDFDDWLMLTRARLEATVLRVLGRLADEATKAGDARSALTATERMFAIDPLHEDTHRRLLEACAAAGRRSEALRHYATIVDVLHRELSVVPARETRELAQRLRREMDPLPKGGSAPASMVPATAIDAGNVPPLAVLPFRQLGDQPVAGHLAEGLVADVVCQLAGLRELRVISHGTTLGMTDPALDARSAGRLLGVRYVVTGSMRRAGNSVRLTAELADAETGMVVWARSHDTDASLSFEDQDRMVAQIVNTLAPRVHELELRRIRGKRPESLTVYEKVLLAREHLQTMEHENFQQARRLLDEAIETEPGYAESYALCADWHGRVISQGWSVNRAADVQAVERLTRKALDLDSGNLRALVFYAHRKSLLHRDYSEARRLFGRALDLSPNSAQAWLWSSYTHAYVGDADEALRRAFRALELSPRDRQAHDFFAAICVANYTAGNYQDAADWGLRALGEQSVSRGTYRWTAASLAANGQEHQARQVMRRAMDEMPNQHVSEVVRISPYSEDERRRGYGMHLLAAGFPP
jgi:TolB-like protein/Tfp pilus assembly protein PilF